MPKFNIFKTLSGKIKRSNSKSSVKETGEKDVVKVSETKSKESKSSPSLNTKKKVVQEDPEVTQLNNITNLFNHYSGGEDSMDTDAVIKFLEDINLDPEDINVIVLSWYFKAAAQCTFTKNEFIQGFQALKVDSIEKLKEKVPTFAADLKDPTTFSSIYDFTFMWSREAPDKKTLDMETACDMLEVLLEDRYPFCAPFREFLVEQISYKSINRDQWCSFWEFCTTAKSDLSGYDENSSWPVMLDEFVCWLKEKSPEKYTQDCDTN